MGFLDDLKKKKDIVDGFADGIRDGRYRKEHPISFVIHEGASRLEDAIRGEDYANARKAGIEYVEKYEK